MWPLATNHYKKKKKYLFYVIYLDYCMKLLKLLISFIYQIIYKKKNFGCCVYKKEKYYLLYDKMDQKFKEKKKDKRKDMIKNTN